MEETISKAKVTFKNEELTDDDVLNHLRHGKRVTAVALNWDDKIEFSIDKKIAIKSLKYSEAFEPEESYEDQVDSDDAFFTLTAAEYSTFIPAVLALVTE